MGYVYGLQCERKCLFSCLHFERISDFFNLVRYFVMARLWRLIFRGGKRGIFYALLYAGASFSISQVIVGEMFISFRYHMCEDKEVLDE